MSEATLRERVLPGPAAVPRNVYYIRLGDRANPYTPTVIRERTDQGSNRSGLGRGLNSHYRSSDSFDYEHVRGGSGYQDGYSGRNSGEHYSDRRQAARGRRRYSSHEYEQYGDRSSSRGYDEGGRSYSGRRPYAHGPGEYGEDRYEQSRGYNFDGVRGPGPGPEAARREPIRREAARPRAQGGPREAPAPRSGVSQPSIRFLHVQADDIVVSLTGAPSYILELKLRCSPNQVVDASHPYVYSMTPFHARLQLPHAEGRLLGVRARAVRSGPELAQNPNLPRLGRWTPWHSHGAGRFREDYSGVDPYVAPPYEPEEAPGEAHYWSGEAPWRPEIFGGDEPYDREAEAIAAEVTPGPGAYDTASHHAFGSLPAYKRGPTASFASGVGREGRSQNRPSGSRIFTNYERAQSHRSAGELMISQGGTRASRQPPRQTSQVSRSHHPPKVPKQPPPPHPAPPSAGEQWAKGRPMPPRKAAADDFDRFPVEGVLSAQDGDGQVEDRPTTVKAILEKKGGPLPPRTMRPEMAKPRVIDAWTEWADMPDMLSLPKCTSRQSDVKSDALESVA